MTPDTSGRTSLSPSAYYDLDTFSWRTSGAMFPSDWPTSSETCPVWGMTRDGELYALPTPELPTVEPASSSSQLLPTPVVNDMGEGKTPESWDDWTARMQAKHGNGNGRGASLSIEAQRLLPTPVSDNSRGLPQPGTDYSSLPNAVLSLLPTPNTMDALPRRSDEALARAKQSGGCSNLKDHPLIRSSGAPTPPPSPAGSESPGVTLLDLLSEEGPASA